MIETQADSQRLSSIDAATSLGRLADEVVIAVSRRMAGKTLTLENEAALARASEWLDGLSGQLAKPLDVSHVGAVGQLSRLRSFGPDVTRVAIDAIGTRTDTDAGVKALRNLRDLTNSVASGQTDQAHLGSILAVFESIARAMLAIASSIFESNTTKSAWHKTFAF